MVRSSFRILVLFGFLASAHGGSPAPRGDAGEPWLIQPLDFVPATRGELGKSFSSAYTKRVEVLADRHEYFADDVNAQFLVMFFDKVKAEDAGRFSIRLELTDAKNRKLLENRTVANPGFPLRFGC